MSWGYVIGPLALMPLLGALFFVPRPGTDGGPALDRASLSLLVCHGSPGSAVTLLPPDSLDRGPTVADGLRVRLDR